MRRSKSLVTPVLVAALVLVGCSTPHTPVGGDHEETPPPPVGRQGWQVTATNVFGDWLPTETCGGDYMFVNGLVLLAQEYLTDLDGNQSYDGPSLEIVHWGEERGWQYMWGSNIHDLAAGDFVDGGKDNIDWAPGADGHPPATFTVSGAHYRTVRADNAGWEDHRGADTLTLRFERIPEPDWCLEDEEYFNDPANDALEWAWEYYD